MIVDIRILKKTALGSNSKSPLEACLSNCQSIRRQRGSYQDSNRLSDVLECTWGLCYLPLLKGLPCGGSRNSNRRINRYTQRCGALACAFRSWQREKPRKLRSTHDMPPAGEKEAKMILTGLYLSFEAYQDSANIQLLNGRSGHNPWMQRFRTGFLTFLVHVGRGYLWSNWSLGASCFTMSDSLLTGT
ncbi:unnamed protein product [Somion occarium]|uniref:Uncharacterized protein n=1 Tax=Somion occarium TaxID=3059160 RepID=A0ABP1CYU9_9APHY